MELRHLHVFLAAAEELHFSRAASRLHVAQPALSRTIRDLEEELGAALFERNTRKVKLTDAGEDFLQSARRILDETKTAVESARRVARGESGVLRIGFIGTLSHQTLPQLLQAYHQRFPSVELSLVEAAPQRQKRLLAQEQLDCGFIGFFPGEDAGELATAVAYREPLMAALPVNHPLADRKTLQLNDLRDEPIYLPARENAPTYNPWIISLCLQAGFEPVIVKETDHAVTVLCSVAAGFAVTVFPEQICQLATPGVRFLPFDPALPPYEYVVAWRRNDHRRHLAEFLKLVGKA